MNVSGGKDFDLFRDIANLLNTQTIQIIKHLTLDVRMKIYKNSKAHHEKFKISILYKNKFNYKRMYKTE
jgi:hypothetical protein